MSITRMSRTEAQNMILEVRRRRLAIPKNKKMSSKVNLTGFGEGDVTLKARKKPKQRKKKVVLDFDKMSMEDKLELLKRLGG